MHPNVQHAAVRRVHGAEFKAKVLAQCREPGASVAAVAMANGVNANLVRKWLAGHGLKRAGLAAHDGTLATAVQKVSAGAAAPSAPAMRFVPVALEPRGGGGELSEAPGTQTPAAAEVSHIHIELRRGNTALAVRWPTAQAQGCTLWLSELAGAVLKG